MPKEPAYVPSKKDMEARIRIDQLKMSSAGGKITALQNKIAMLEFGLAFWKNEFLEAFKTARILQRTACEMEDLKKEYKKKQEDTCSA